MAILGEKVLVFMVPESTSVSQARIWFRHTSAAEVNMRHFGPLKGDVFLYPSALCCSEASCFSREPPGKVFVQSKGKEGRRG